MAKRKRPPGRRPQSDAVGVIYARYSSHNQKDASIEQQVSECTKYAQEIGLHIVETYADRAISGRTDNRPNFQKMMKDAEHGKFQYVIAWKSNRIGRNMLQAMQNESRLNDLGIKCMYVEEDFDDSAAGRFALRSMMNVNQFYSENMAEDIRRGMYDNAAQCKVTNGGLPFGYRASKDLHYELDSPKDKVVREIFERVARREPFVDIASDLNARGIRTRNGKPWGRSSFQNLLHNERYRGIYIYGDVRIEGGVPRIVSDELFFKVQEVLKMKKNPQGKHRGYGDYLLTGKLYCGHCNSPMIGMSGTSAAGELHSYYVCHKKRREHACNKKNISRDLIEEAIARAIQVYCLADETIEWIAKSTVAYFKKKEQDPDLLLLESELADTKKSLKNYALAIGRGIFNDTTQEAMLELERKQKDLFEKIAAKRADIIEIREEDIISGLSMMRHGNVKDKKYQSDLFNTFLVRVYLYDDNNLKIIFSFTGDKNTITIPLSSELTGSSESPVGGSVRQNSDLGHQYGNPSEVVLRGFVSLFLQLILVFPIFCENCF